MSQLLGAVLILALAPAEGARSGQTSFFNEGKTLVLGVDVRPSRIAGPRELLPVAIVVLNREKQPLTFSGESFTLVRSDGARLPLATTDEYWESYRRGSVDVRLATPFFERAVARHPVPPFRWTGLDLFPSRHSGIVPRDGLTLRLAEGAFGLLYFRHSPGDGVPSGSYQLLFRPHDSPETYVLDFPPYGKVKQAKQAKTGGR